ncbi:MAG TPA: FGGY-family carbohydrate kinase, partial [Thermoleophilia bacterium]|nr:FGGY-family carbohydrate kinase [Thermoleophilia bacterium]
GGLPLPSLPAVLPSDAILRLAAPTAAALDVPAGLPVVVGAADSVLGCVGLEVTRPGEVAYVAGTSTVVLGVADRPALDDGHRFLVTPLAATAGWGLEMDLLATGSAVHWLAGLLGEARGDEARLMAMAAGVEPGAGGLSFLPFVAPGEQGALWDPSLTGTVMGLSLSHGQAQVARALVDGIVLESRRCLDVLEQVGLPRGDMHVAGGSGADPVFRQQLADASRRRVVYAGDGETAHSALGAARLAAAAAGRPLTVPAALRPDEDDPPEPRGWAPDGAQCQVFEPRESEAAHWDELWDRHEQALSSIRGARPGPLPGA